MENDLQYVSVKFSHGALIGCTVWCKQFLKLVLNVYKESSINFIGDVSLM